MHPKKNEINTMEVSSRRREKTLFEKVTKLAYNIAEKAQVEKNKTVDALINKLKELKSSKLPISQVKQKLKFIMDCFREVEKNKKRLLLMFVSSKRQREAFSSHLMWVLWKPIQKNSLLFHFMLLQILLIKS